MTVAIPYDTTDLLTMAKTLYGEIRGYRIEDQTAVAWAIRNRASRNNMPFMAGDFLNHPGAVTHVCRYPWQFSCWNSGDPNRPLLDAMTVDDPKITSLVALAKSVLDGATPDNVEGSDHYYTVARPAWAEQWPPAWAAQYKKIVQVGPHIFHDSMIRVG